MEALARHLTAWIAAEVTAAGGAGAVFGLSGGLDSAV
ncbi:MAG: NAD(+) synthetase, partial [Actinobacteria bacterium]|nr:NAD(+) synthetase [Actinomycetota bacterium]